MARRVADVRGERRWALAGLCPLRGSYSIHAGQARLGLGVSCAWHLAPAAPFALRRARVGRGRVLFAGVLRVREWICGEVDGEGSGAAASAVTRNPCSAARTGTWPPRRVLSPPSGPARLLTCRCMHACPRMACSCATRACCWRGVRTWWRSWASGRLSSGCGTARTSSRRSTRSWRTVSMRACVRACIMHVRACMHARCSSARRSPVTTPCTACSTQQRSAIKLPAPCMRTDICPGQRGGHCRCRLSHTGVLSETPAPLPRGPASAAAPLHPPTQCTAHPLPPLPHSLPHSLLLLLLLLPLLLLLWLGRRREGRERQQGRHPPRAVEQHQAVLPRAHRPGAQALRKGHQGGCAAAGPTPPACMSHAVMLHAILQVCKYLGVLHAHGQL